MAVNRDTNFLAILERAQTLQKERPKRAYGNLLEAIGTNDLARYFQFPEAKNESILILRPQPIAARSGWPHPAGDRFKRRYFLLLRMETNRLAGASDVSTALSQAVEVLRKRVDKFGVAEPVIQPAGSDRILVELPGLFGIGKDKHDHQA